MSRRQQIQDMLADDPKDPFLRYALALEHVAEKDDAAAARVFGDLIGDSPDYVPAYFQCGQALLRLNRAEDARQVLQAGLSAADKAGDVHTADEIRGLLGTT